MIIWKGWGFLVAVICFANSLIANLITNSFAGGPAYWKAHSWPFAVSLFPSAAICWFLGNYLTKRKPRLVVDKETGEEITLMPSHELFFVNMRWWGPIFLTIGVVLLVKDVL